MLRADMVINPDDTPLEDRKVTLDGIGMSIATNVFPAGVVDGFVAGEHRREDSVLALAIGHKARLSGIQLRVKDWAQIRSVDGRKVERTRLAGLPFNQRKDHLFSQTARRILQALTRMLVVLLPANVGFVRFNRIAADREHTAACLHGFANAVRHKPRGFVLDPKAAL